MAGLGFARSQLEKQGWAEGKGLGKEEDGIKKAIKVGIKNDTQGVGYKVSNQFTFHWWDHVFNKTAKSIVVKENEDGVLVTKEGTSNQPISSKRPNKHSQKPLLYGRFVKASSATTPGDVESESDNTDEEAEKDFSSKHPEDIVFKACGGRTAHKGARHGLKLNGKLKRIEEQERLALSAPCSRSASPDVTKEHDIEQKTAELLDLLKSKKKKRKSKDDDLKSYSDSEGCVVKKKKKRKRNREEDVNDLEHEARGAEKSKQNEKKRIDKDLIKHNEEPKSCSNRETIKKKKKDKKRKSENKKDKTGKRKKLVDSSDGECSEVSLDELKDEKTQSNYKKDKRRREVLCHRE
ncbi:G patch domain-containing protein 4-like [Actinia tenebrosa]|uniref:G patch domain-containing protein 4 n=1 Tax=Actinia tenebrosa TaxID=6105 RepID=A0A6P8IC06_ACTTE|nr:G patch domain-containing protein 4-like [Actinia tenebrosa]